MFKGWLDNRADIAAELGINSIDSAAVYGAAVEAWGHGAESRVLGCYCAAIDDPVRGELRLSRSALSAPTLHYFARDGAIGASTLPRALVSLGLPQALNQRKLIDALLANPCADEGFYEGAWRVDVGEVVHLSAERRSTRRSFDPLAPRAIVRGDRRELVMEADRLLEAAASAATRDEPTFGLQLSGGLDSGNLAARVLRVVPDRRIKSFTFTPLAGWRDPGSELFFGNERPAVEAFAAMHPRIEPYFTDNSGRGYDSELDLLLRAMGTAPSVLAPSFAFRGLAKLAGEHGCNLLLAADMGNFSFSQTGGWGYAEYFRRGRWGELARALRNEPNTTRPLWRRFLSRSLIPHLPDPLWRAWKRAKGQAVHADNTIVGLVRNDALAHHDAVARARAAGTWYERDQYAWREDLLRDQFARGDGDSADLHQAFEQIYGVRWRDATAYRPLVEFCLALPTDMFLHDGEQRWLARELGRGVMPEGQRRQTRVGLQVADWHARLTPRLAEIRGEFARARSVPEIDAVLDLDRIERLLDAWPAEPTHDLRVIGEFAVGLTSALTAARFITQTTGSNR